MSKSISIWLFTCAAMVLSMAVIGAITRLTGSGLSMVEWRPLIGALPPLTEAEWQRVFDLYQQSPEFIHKNNWMDLSAFKEIFFWEWFHRLWGRLIGVVYALPLLFFWLRGIVPTSLKPKLIIGLILGGLQGLMGWYMVKSGLADNPYVSHYRLAAHLSLAFLIYSYLLWLAFAAWPKNYDATRLPASNCLKRHGIAAFAAVFITLIWGAFVAGLDAGLIYNSWPLMNGNMFPDGSFAPLNEAGWVQFIHRWIAALAVILVIDFTWRGWRELTQVKWIFICLGLAVIGQFTLGIATLILGVYLPLATLHQFGAFIVGGFCVLGLYQCYKA